MKKSITLLLVFAILISLFAVTDITASAKENIKLSATSIKLVIGKTKKLTVKNTKKTVKWSSSKKSVAKVDKKGKVTAKSAGTAKITAKVAGKKLTCKVTVYKKFKLKKSTDYFVMYHGGYLDYSGGFGAITWASSNTKIATIDKKGKLSALKPGVCTISATRNGIKSKCKVFVKPNFEVLYDDYCEYEWSSYSISKKELALDSNPANIEYGSTNYLENTFNDKVYEAVSGINYDLGLPESVLQDMQATTAEMGVRTLVYETFKIAWSYHPDKGLEILYSVI